MKMYLKRREGGRDLRDEAVEDSGEVGADVLVAVFVDRQRGRCVLNYQPITLST